MNLRPGRFRIGLRTVKTAAAVILSMAVVDLWGATGSKLIFAMLGAMAAVQPTFKESLEASLAQIVGVLFGATACVLLLQLPFPPLMIIGVGIVLVITLYNYFHIRFSPSLPCFIVVMLCTETGIRPMEYALGRVWDTAIGLSIGFAINLLIFPYDNSRQIRSTVESLDRELLRFLEDLFDGDDRFPDAREMAARADRVRSQLKIYSNQRLLLHLRRQRRQLEAFRLCEEKARELVARMEILSSSGSPGRLNPESRRALEAAGVTVRDRRPLDAVTQRDVVTNWHVAQLLRLRREMLEALKKQ